MTEGQKYFSAMRKNKLQDSYRRKQERNDTRIRNNITRNSKKEGDKRKMTSYEYADKISEILDDALNKLSPEAFNMLLDNVSMLLEDYE